jgi:ribonucleotide monophosphatase NagD (HAD superfamily)
MEPTGLRTYLLLGDVLKAQGRPERIPEVVRKFRIVVEAHGGHSLLKESHRDKIHSFVFGGDDEAMELFNSMEKDYLSVGEGAEEALTYMKKTLGKVGKDAVSRFLNGKKLIRHFECMYTPQGKIDLKSGSIDESYKGKTKESGQLYERLLEELKGQGIKPGEMIMVGDKIETDINPSRRLGIKTVQYTGYIDQGPSEADYRVSSFFELKDLLKGMIA